MTDNAAHHLATTIRLAGEAVEACVLDAFPEHADRSAGLLVRLEPDAVDRLIACARPKVIYLVEVAFDPVEELEEVSEALAALGVENLPAPLKTAHRRVADHAGEIHTTLVGFMIEGVLHTTTASAAWHDAFDEVVDEVLAAARERAEVEERAQAGAANAEIAAKAAILAGHPSFNFSRVSFEKRLTLAEALFTDCGDLDLREVTRVAENLFWLAQSGFKSSAGSA